MNETKKVWLITGAARGIGRAIMNAALEHGDCVAAITRTKNSVDISEKYADHLLTMQLDVSESDQNLYREMVEKIMNRFGQIDVLVNNAGYGSVTNFEETREETIRRLFEVNLFGLMRVTRTVLPVMRGQRSGHIFNIASAAGYGAGPVPYHTSKFAVTGFSTSLAFEVESFGIKVTNVAPGLFRTNFYDKGKWETEPDIFISDYDEGRWQTDFVKNARKKKQPGDPDKLAALVVEVAYCENPPLHLAVGADAPGVLDAYGEKLKQDTDAWREKAIRAVF